jgi:hypothetical protein
VVKILLVFLLIVAGIGFVYWLIHPYIRLARKAVGFIRDIRTGTFNTNVGGGQREKVAASQKLAQCARCGTWVPAGRAIAGRGNAVFCSQACAENREAR